MNQPLPKYPVKEDMDNTSLPGTTLGKKAPETPSLLRHIHGVKQRWVGICLSGPDVTFW